MHFIQIMNAWCHVSREFLAEVTVMDEGGIAGEESVQLNKSACFIFPSTYELYTSVVILSSEPFTEWGVPVILLHSLPFITKEIT